MALLREIAKKELIPAGLESHYTEQGGVFVLNVEGDGVPEYRQNNITLAHQVKHLTGQLKRFDGIDPDAVRGLMEEKAKLEEQSALKAGEFEKVMASRTAALRAEVEKKAADAAAAQSQLAAYKIDQAVTGEATKRGLRSGAVRDITLRAKNIFRLVDGVPRAVESDGVTIRLAKDGAAPLSVAEWIEEQASEAPHLFEPNAGGGAVGNISGGGAGSSGMGLVPGKNPFKKGESWNMTEQMRIERKDPALAARLAAAA